MRRIPSFDPSVATTQPYISVGAADPNTKILLYNESPYNLDLDFYNGNNSILHAWEARYWVLDGDTPQIGWTLDSSLNVSNPPISLVMGELYGPNEDVQGSYPMALIRQASVGNPGGINTNVSTSSSISNTGNPAGTNVITASSTGATGNTFNLTNDGILALLVTIAGALVDVIQTHETDPVLQLGAATHLVEILGNLQVDGTVFHAGNSFFGGITNAAATAEIKSSGAVIFDNGSISSDGSGDITANRFNGPLSGNATTATTANSANALNEGINLPGGLGRTAADDVLSIASTVITHSTGGVGTNVDNTIKAAGTGKVRLNAGGVDDVIADGNNGIYLPNGYIGKTVKGDFADFSGTGVYFKANGGYFIWQSPSGTNVFTRAKENHGTIVAVAAGTVTVTHGMGRVPDFIVVTPNNGTAGSQTFAVWNVTTTTFQIYNAANTPTYWWKCENYT